MPRFKRSRTRKLKYRILYLGLPSPVTYSAPLKLRLGASLDFNTRLKPSMPQRNNLFTSLNSFSLRFDTTSGSEDGGRSLNAWNSGKYVRILFGMSSDFFSPSEVDLKTYYGKDASTETRLQQRQYFLVTAQVIKHRLLCYIDLVMALSYSLLNPHLALTWLRRYTFYIFIII